MSLPALSVSARASTPPSLGGARRGDVGLMPAAKPTLEPPGLADLFRRYARYVATIGLRLLGRDDELDDLVQDVFIEAHRGLHGLRTPDAIKGWLARITVR